MKIKLERLFFGTIFFQILATQGVLFFIIFNFFGNWELKKLVHPISFFVVFSVFFLKSAKSVKATFIDLLFFGYLSILFVFMFFNVDNMEGYYLVFREVFLLFILIYIFHQVEISEEKWNQIVQFLFLLLIGNTIFIFLTSYMGPEKFMTWVTGRYVWGIDPEYKIKISNFYKFWRSPALIGDAASVGYFSVFSYIFMDDIQKFRKKKYFALIPLFFSFVRSAYLVFLVYEFLKFFTIKKNLKRLILVLKIGVPIFIGILFVLSNYSILSTTSLLERFELWSIDYELEYNYLFGGAIGNVGGGARGEGFIATLDSYWLFLFFSSGIIGVFLALTFILEKSRNTNKFLFTLIAFGIAGFFVNLTQSIVFLAMFPLLFISIKKNNGSQRD